jgi:hypothetical protein
MASSTLADLQYQYYAQALGISLTAAMNQSINDLEYQALTQGVLTSGGTATPIRDEGVQVVAAPNKLNFVGPIITAASDGAGGANVTVAPTALLTPSNPVGQISATNVQAALQQIDQKQTLTQWIENLKTGTDVFDEFWGQGSVVAPAVSSNFGVLGWNVVTGGTNASVQFLGSNPFPGVLSLILATSPGDRVHLDIGASVMELAHIFMNEWRVQTVQLNGADAQSIWVGLHNDTASVEPTTGYYFRYTAADGVNWKAVVANAGTYSVYDTGFAADGGANAFHRFRITCDGTNYRFYIDDNLVAGPATANIPTGTNRYAPAISTIKTAGAGIRTCRVDYMALHYELPR